MSGVQPESAAGPLALETAGRAPAAGLMRLPRAARLTLYVLATRLWAELWLVAGSYFPKKAPDFWHAAVGDVPWYTVPVRLLDVWGRWDTFFYVGIARYGYPPPVPGEEWVYNAAYFPLFPSLMRGLSTLLGGLDVFYCGILAANVLLLLGVLYVDKLARLDHPPAAAELIVACLLCYPGSHFFSCVYPESTALFLGAFALYCARTGRTLASGLACGLAAITRSSGLLVSLAVLYEFCRRPDGKLRPSWKALALGFVPLCLGLLMAVNYDLYRDPLYFAHVQAGWGRRASWPFLALFRPAGLSLDYHLFALAVVALVLLGLRRRRERESTLVLGVANVLLPLSTGILNGIYRYMGSNFPLFFILGNELKERPRLKRLYLAAGLGTLALFSFKWGQGYQPN